MENSIRTNSTVHKASPFRNCILCVASVLVALFAANPEAGVLPAQSMHLSEYIEMFLPRAGVGSPEFPVVLEVAPVIMEMKLRAAYHPDQAFKDKFVDELRQGVITFFDRKALFTAVRESGGELKMVLRVVSYEASRKANPQNMLLRIEISLIDVRHHKSVLYGKAGSKVIIPIKQLSKTINLTPPGGGKSLAIQRGTLELGVLCMRIFENIEQEIRKNKKHILNSIKM